MLPCSYSVYIERASNSPRLTGYSAAAVIGVECHPLSSSAPLAKQAERLTLDKMSYKIVGIKLQKSTKIAQNPVKSREIYGKEA
jgi:hypothetical protein